MAAARFVERLNEQIAPELAQTTAPAVAGGTR